VLVKYLNSLHSLKHPSHLPGLAESLAKYKFENGSGLGLAESEPRSRSLYGVGWVIIRRESAMRLLMGAITCCYLFGLAAVLAVGAALFRVAVSLTNKSLGATANSKPLPEDDELDEWIGYRQLRRKSQGIAEPHFGRAVVSLIVLAVINVLTSLLMRLLFGLDPFNERGFTSRDIVFIAQFLALILSLPPGAWVLTSILSTGFARACLVMLYLYGLVLAIIVGIMSILYILS
jgi:hypothetical protein